MLILLLDVRSYRDTTHWQKGGAAFDYRAVRVCCGQFAMMMTINDPERSQACVQADSRRTDCRWDPTSYLLGSMWQIEGPKTVYSSLER